MPTTSKAKYHYHVIRQHKEMKKNSGKVTEHTRQKITAILIANMRIAQKIGGEGDKNSKKCEY